MKKIIFSLMLVSLLSVAGNAYAATDPIGNGDPRKVVQAWGMNDYDTPKIAAGQTITDEFGLTHTCPALEIRGCNNIARTDWYRNYMFDLARQLLANGYWAQFPQYNRLYQLVK